MFAFSLQIRNSLKLTPSAQQRAQIHTWNTETLSPVKLANGSTVASFKYLPETDSICIILANGDIEQIFEPGADGPIQKKVSYRSVHFSRS